jgi:hypothetical protein
MLDDAHPAMGGAVRAVSRREIAQVTGLARQHLIESGRASHVIYQIEVVRSDMITIHHGEPPKHVGDCLEQFFYDRVEGHWKLRNIEGVCGENLPVG